jgi:hypothetical protein
LDRTQVIPTHKGPLQERSLDIGRALKNVNLIQSSLDCRANVEQSNHQCFERSAKICEPLDIEVKKPTIWGFLKARHIWIITMVTTKSKLQMEFNKEVTSASSGLVYVCFGSFVKCSRVRAIAGKKYNLSLFYF